MASKYDLYLKNELRHFFNERYLQLSERAKTVLRTNGLARWSKFKAVLRNENFSFSTLKHCGVKTSLELSALSHDIKKKEADLYTEINQKKEADLYATISRYGNNTHKSNLCDYNLSVRAQNCLRKSNIQTIEDLISFHKSKNLLTIQNLGKKTLEELTAFIAAYNTSSKEIVNKEFQKVNPIQNKDTNINNNCLISSDIDFATFFKQKHGYLPMLYLIEKHLDSYKDKDIKTLYDKYGIEKWDKLNELRRGSVKYLYDTIELKLVNDPIIINLCKNKDWWYYGLYNLFVDYSYFWYSEGAFISKEMFDKEDITLKEYILKQNENSLLTLIQIKPRTRVNELFILNLFGLKSLWIDGTKKSVSSRQNHSLNSSAKQLLVNKKYIEFNYNKAFKEVVRLTNIRTKNNISIPINSYFINNEDYWKKPISLNEKERYDMYRILSELIKYFYGISIKDGVIIIEANRADYSDELYEILKDSGQRLHIDDLLNKLNDVCKNNGYQCVFKDVAQIRRFLTNDPRIVPYGKSSYWGLKEWGESIGSIRDTAIRYVKNSKKPIQLYKLAKLVLKERPDTNEKSVLSIIWQSTSCGELLLFYGDYVGYPQATYINDYILMPQTFKEWLQAFKDFVLKNKRYPTNNQKYEGYLYRWHHRASQLTELSPEEIIQFDTLEKELYYYPHNTMEYNFLHNCDLYRKFVDGNNRMLEQTDDINLFKWFANASMDYSTYEDNRKLYFSKLLQYISSKLY